MEHIGMLTNILSNQRAQENALRIFSVLSSQKFSNVEHRLALAAVIPKLVGKQLPFSSAN